MRRITPQSDAHRKVDLAVGCLLGSFLINLEPLTPRYDEHHEEWLHGSVVERDPVGAGLFSGSRLKFTGSGLFPIN